ncbi:MAG: alpha-amylase [Eubacterium sp.]|nr:alpha-amylase [Eubacterium sp.]
MATTTDLSLRNQMIYCVYVRNYGRIGNFKEVKSDLDRIQKLGADIVWLLPIHPIGHFGRKGMLGSPYAVADYYKVNPEYGTMDEFTQLVDAIYDHGMKCMMDMVFNHTAKDSVLMKQHPEWFIQDEHGQPTTLVPEWSDIVDLDFSKTQLWDYLIEVLKYWAMYADGFRCNMACKIPLEFWEKARKEVDMIRPGCIWLAESGEGAFIRRLRKEGKTALSDSELYQVFDMCYDYDLKHAIDEVHSGAFPLEAFSNALQLQESSFPDNYVKLHALEDHSRARAAMLYPEGRALRNMTAFSYFEKGAVLICNGQEKSDVHRPSLFEKDDVNWRHEDMTAFMQQLKRIKEEEIYREGTFEVTALKEEYLYATYTWKEMRRIGIFSVTGKTGVIPTDLPDGTYTNQITRNPVEVCGGLLLFSGEPVIIEYNVK